MDLFSAFPSVISYQSNTEYREWIRKIFHFTKDTKSYYADLTEKDMASFSTMDAESKDEMEFDMVTMERGLDFLLTATKDDFIFEELYILAAATMISTDIKIGQTVLCSYDFFHLYYTCLWYFFQEKTRKIETLPEYKRLYAIFRK